MAAHIRSSQLTDDFRLWLESEGFHVFQLRDPEDDDPCVIGHLHEDGYTIAHEEAVRRYGRSQVADELHSRIFSRLTQDDGATRSQISAAIQEMIEAPAR